MYKYWVTQAFPTFIQELSPFVCLSFFFREQEVVMKLFKSNTLKYTMSIVHFPETDREIYNTIFNLINTHFTCLFLAWKRADLLALLYVMFSCVFVTFAYGVLDQVWIPDLCLLPYFAVCLQNIINVSFKWSIVFNY